MAMQTIIIAIIIIIIKNYKMYDGEYTTDNRREGGERTSRDENRR
jgi:hypothetical protein